MRRKKTVSSCKCEFSTAASSQQHGSRCNLATPTTTRRRSMAPNYPECWKTSNEGTSYHNSLPEMPTSATVSSKCRESMDSHASSSSCYHKVDSNHLFGYEAALSRQFLTSKRVIPLLLTVLLVLMPLAYAQPELSLPFGVGLGQSRFMNFAGSSTRDNIRVVLFKNVTEDIPVGEILATFRAEDKTSLTYNLT